jgi:hypothetical protein
VDPAVRTGVVGYKMESKYKYAKATERIIIGENSFLELKIDKIVESL